MINLTTLGLAAVLIFQRTPWWIVWIAVAGVLIFGFYLGSAPWTGALPWVALIALIGIRPIRRRLLTARLLGWARQRPPELSDTEREALEAGKIGLEADLPSGNPQWARYFDITPRFSAENRLF